MSDATFCAMVIGVCNCVLIASFILSNEALFWLGIVSTVSMIAVMVALGSGER